MQDRLIWNPTLIKRRRIFLRGLVQGVGFRPFVFRLAREIGLAGWVRNTPEGVTVEIEGEEERLESFLHGLRRRMPPRAYLQSLEKVDLDPKGYSVFEILPSEKNGERLTLVMPDIATCPECLEEIFDPLNRRYRYPFTNCTQCGPRFTIIEKLPYDRQSTSMKCFEMCSRCRAEYEDPRDRRFHAEPNACPECGPEVASIEARGSGTVRGEEALGRAASAILEGSIVAVKGLGGFHFFADSRNSSVLARLRRRKRREEKPLAVMFPSIEAVRESCVLGPREEEYLLSPEAPIVLVRSKPANGISEEVAPGNPYLGAILPYTPLHHLLLRLAGIPLVATSGNFSDETIAIREEDALNRFRGIADLFLVHNRPILRHADDSVIAFFMNRATILRRARGFAPLPVGEGLRDIPCLALGASQKNSIAVSARGRVFVSQHVGDMDHPLTYSAFVRTVQDMKTLCGIEPEAVAADLHPDYPSGGFARTCGIPVFHVQHHHAHVLSCAADNAMEGLFLGVAWDGTGLGTDGTVWGGEFLTAGGGPDFVRKAHLRTFPLPGGDKASKEPRRSAAGVLYTVFGHPFFREAPAPFRHAFSEEEKELVLEMLRKNLCSPRGSSAGRLFDAAASLLGLRQTVGFEGQAAMELEFSVLGNETSEAYPFRILAEAEDQAEESLVLDWEPVIRGILDDTARGVPVGVAACKFHNALAEGIGAMALRIGLEKVVLTGGCFQNRYLTERCVQILKKMDFRPYWHQRVPPNDGGIALGQTAALLANP